MVVVRQGTDKRFYVYRKVKQPNIGGSYKVGCKISSTFKVKPLHRSYNTVYSVDFGQMILPSSFKDKLVQFIVEVVDKEKYEEQK